ncbi:MAG: hypothetical protein HQL69_17265 [Magnetococcales bacterium]|nr:hypothetical protein [Magnetococcales bacterium]
MAMFQIFSYPITLRLSTFFLCFFLSFPLAAFDKEPILRVEGRMHTEPILRIATDSANSFFVSSSKDKTLRIWQLPSGRLRKIIRVPIAQGAEGELNAVAVSPDGVVIAASGNTCKTLPSEKGYCIYLFDTATGNILSRIKGLPATVLHLAISHNNQYLAVAMSGKAGLRVYHLHNGRLLKKDKDYGGDTTWLDFNKNGALITTSLDGYLRLYDEHFKPQQRKKLPTGFQPYSAKFSPENDKIAVGFTGRHVVIVFSAKDLKVLYFADDTAGVGDFRSVAWSKDGKALYGAGKHKNSRNSLIRWWKDAGRSGVSGWGEFIDLPIYKSTISQIITLKDGDILYSGLAPVLGGVDNEGFLRFRRTKPIATFARWKKSLLLSADGSIVGFPYDKSGKNGGRFVARDLILLNSKAVNDKLYAPITKSKYFSVTGWEDKTGELKLNGVAIALADNEKVSSIAIARNNRFFVVGTSDKLRLLDRIGRARWNSSVLAPVVGLNISLNNRVIVAAHSDGIIRWYRTVTGDHFLSLFPHRDKKRWVAWTPDRYFATSAGGGDILGWHKNRGVNRSAKFVSYANSKNSKLRLERINNLFAH